MFNLNFIIMKTSDVKQIINEFNLNCTTDHDSLFIHGNSGCFIAIKMRQIKDWSTNGHTVSFRTKNLVANAYTKRNMFYVIVF